MNEENITPSALLRANRNSGDPRPLLQSRKATATELGVCVRTVDNLILAGELVSTKIGRRRMIVTSSLANFLKRDHATKTPAEVTG